MTISIHSLRHFADQSRKVLLSLSILLISIPGFVGYDLNLFGLSLGRLQPFKFTFFLWFVSQIAYLALTQYHSILKGLRIKKYWAVWISLLLLDGALIFGHLLEKGGSRGTNILISLILGQCAALISAIDKNFPVRSFLKGLYGATVVLALFGILEQVFADRAWMLELLKTIRDNASTSHQLGSTLTTSALAEFTVRGLPFVLFFFQSSAASLVCAVTLTLLSVFTLEKSSVLSLSAIFSFDILFGSLRRYWKSVVALSIAAVVALVLVKGPDLVFGRYLGGFVQTSNHVHSVNARTSINERLTLWSLALDSIRARPWTGIGLDGFSYRHKNRIAPLEHSTTSEPYHSHNLLLELTISGGVLAGLAFLALLMSYFILALRETPKRYVALLYLVGQLGSMLVDSRIYVSWLAISFFWFAGIAWSTTQERMKSQ